MSSDVEQEKEDDKDTGYWTYCGFSCHDLKQKQQEIVTELLDFNKYNPEYSIVMLGKCMELLYEARNNMIRMKSQPTVQNTS